MKRINIDKSWEFQFGVPSAIPMPWQIKTIRTVDLPHDYMIESDTKVDAPGGQNMAYFTGEIATYTKALDIPKEYINQKIIVEFDGVFSNAKVTLNGHLVALQHYGYSPFHVDLTPFIHYGESNRLAVTIKNSAQPNARWYSGAGIYRHVDLRVSPKLHFAPWGIFAYTSHIVNNTAAVKVETTVVNETGNNSDVWVKLKLVHEKTDKVSGIGKVKIHSKAGSTTIGRVTIAMKDPYIWDIDSPELYKIEAELWDEDHVIDEDNTIFGVRTISVDTENGFVLNGNSLKLKGGCVHHDNGILGAASFKDSEYRKMKIHKENGYNAIRFAHNPMSRDLLDACDRLGLLVINEAFDVWTMEKNTYDYSQFFADDWEKDLSAFMMRDRNHPSVIMWSTGNEVPERGGLSSGYEWALKLAEKVRQLDPSRLVTHSVCSFFNGLEDKDQAKFFKTLQEEAKEATGNMVNLDSSFGREIWGRLTEAFVAPVDVVGYNYLSYHYEGAIEQFPNRVICGTESKPKEMAAYWHEVEKFNHVIGDFNWTSHDYIGEVGIGRQEYFSVDDIQNAAMTMHVVPYPWRTAYDSDFDLCGFPRPQLAYRRIVWGSKETYIVVHNPKNNGKIEMLGRWGWPDCDHSWSWPGFENTKVKIEIYSRADEVELFINGVSQGRQATGIEQVYTCVFEATYNEGSIEAISYSDGIIVSKDVLTSVGEPYKIALTPEQKVLKCDGQALNFVTVEIVDQNGNLVPYAEVKTKARVEGAAILAGFGTGRPITEENYTKGEFTSFKGKLLAVVRSSYTSGKAILTVEGDNLESAVLELDIVE